MNDNNVKITHRTERLEIYRFKPSLFQLYWHCYNKDDGPDYWDRIPHKIRMILALLGKGYEVVYGIDQGRVVGHIVVDYNKKFKGMHSKDIVLGPKWIIPSLRGKGYGSELTYAVLNELGIEYQSSYEFISATNIASIKSSKKNGYEFYSYAKRTRSGNYEPCENGSWHIYKRDNNN